jgi:hypothetical protein
VEKSYGDQKELRALASAADCIAVDSCGDSPVHREGNPLVDIHDLDLDHAFDPVHKKTSQLYRN